jgi:putative phosphoribosyl transferase
MNITGKQKRGIESFWINQEVRIAGDNVSLQGDLIVPHQPKGIVLFAHGSGSSRLSTRNRFVAEVLQKGGIGTLLFDLLTPEEDTDYQQRFDIPLLSRRLILATDWLSGYPEMSHFPFGYFGASTGAPAALIAAAEMENDIKCVVSRGGRPDLAMEILEQVRTPTLLIVGGRDDQVLEWNRQALEKLAGPKKLAIVPGATHLFEEAGTLEKAAALAKDWFLKYLEPGDQSSRLRN